MGKFKKGDRVKVISVCNGSKAQVGDFADVIGYSQINGLLEVQIVAGPIEQLFDWRFELVTPAKPTGFEVGKKYTLISDGHIVEVVYNTDKQWVLKNQNNTIFIVKDTDYYYYTPYIPPPPEEWRIVFNDKKTKIVTLGTIPFTSEDAAKNSSWWRLNEHIAIKAIRVDA